MIALEDDVDSVLDLRETAIGVAVLAVVFGIITFLLLLQRWGSDPLAQQEAIVDGMLPFGMERATLVKEFLKLHLALLGIGLLPRSLLEGSHRLSRLALARVSLVATVGVLVLLVLLGLRSALLL